VLSAWASGPEFKQFEKARAYGISQRTTALKGLRLVEFLRRNLMHSAIVK
jgi:hypothetical protein